MKAIVIERFGGADQMKLVDLPTPKAGDNEVVVEIHSTSVNPVDWKIREGYLKDHVPHQFPIILGWDAAGVVSEVGKNVTRFKKGDRVYSYCRKPTVQWGTYAEYIALEERNVAHMPAKLNFAVAASVPLVALTAWQALFDLAALKSGETAVILGGAGGVGGFAIQFAKNAGAKVYSTASAKNSSYLRELGATPIDYNAGSVIAAVKAVAPEGADVVFDCVGGKSLEEAYSFVKSGGRLVSIVDTPDAERAKSLGIKTAYHFVSPNGDELAEIARLIDQGKVVPLPVEEMPLAEAAAAQEKNRERHTRGKISLKVK